MYVQIGITMLGVLVLILGLLLAFPNIYKRKAIPRGRTIIKSEHKSWGDSIVWTKWPELQVHGWLWERPEVGDILVEEFTSGKKGEFQFTHVKHCHDPSDMFFGTLKFLGYIKEPTGKFCLRAMNADMVQMVSTPDFQSGNASSMLAISTNLPTRLTVLGGN